MKDKDLWVEGVSPSTALKDTELKLTYTDSSDGEISEDPVKVTIFGSSLTLYGGDETTAVGIHKEADPGAYVWYNRDDDDKNNAEDRTDSPVTDENDLIKAHFAFEAIFDNLQTGKVVIGRADTKIKLWKESTKTNEITFVDNKKTYDLSNGDDRTAFGADVKDKDLWVEGSTASSALKDTELKLTYTDSSDEEISEDPVKVTGRPEGFSEMVRGLRDVMGDDTFVSYRYAGRLEGLIKTLHGSPYARFVKWLRIRSYLMDGSDETGNNVLEGPRRQEEAERLMALAEDPLAASPKEESPVLRDALTAKAIVLLVRGEEAEARKLYEELEATYSRTPRVDEASPVGLLILAPFLSRLRTLFTGCPRAQ